MSQYPPPGSYQPPPEPYPGQTGQPEYWQESPRGKGLAITALVLGIIALIGFWTIVGGILFGLLAIIFGVIAFVKARRGTAGGAVMAVIGAVLGALALAATIAALVIGWNFFVDSGGQDFFDCVQQAGSDQAAVQRCEQEWNQRIEDQYGVTLTPPEPAR
ncbi:DUF4190 domain-containing protein [Nocardia donostiensis]|uniref:DUF4190 domain-containing protein n=1 Tax=Nocardia donostiensis TaxID=1538463 RepID=A0A1V2THR3_9NOCA|nr:DUF4190 domain-containing protein [Nocardia donostiensis]ONM49055.1 DUF4190 domain-containing protein [Nocardia donostiensis]OQS14072.1 DUF4190 domain-containing protein [Nocardia donostiensis]OQS19766.1 DUF4190 domain-containing protein [Nocardia donostiensis]